MRKLLITLNKGAFGFFIMILSLGFQNNLFSQEAVSIKRITSPIEFDGIPQ